MRQPERKTPENKILTSDNIELSEYDNLCKNFLHTEKTIWVATNIYYITLISIAGFIIKTFDKLDWILFLIIPAVLIIIIVLFHSILKKLSHVNILQQERILQLEKKVSQVHYMTVNDIEDERYLEMTKNVIKLEFIREKRERRKYLTGVILSTWSILTLIWSFL